MNDADKIDLILDNLLLLLDTISTEKIVDKESSDDYLKQFRAGVRILMKIIGSEIECELLRLRLEFFDMDNYSKECECEDIDEIKNLDRIPVSKSVRGILIVYIRLYFNIYENLMEKNEDIALSLYTILEEEEQRRCVDQYKITFGSSWGLELEGLDYILMYNLILKKIKIIRRLLDQKRVPEAFIIYISIIKYIIEYFTLSSRSFFGKDTDTIIQQIQNKIIDVGNDITKWNKEAEKVIRERNITT